MSVLDLLRWTEPTLLVGPDAGLWREGASGTNITVVTVGGRAGDVFDDGADATFLGSYAIGPAGAVLVRQDGVVALRQVAAPESATVARTELLHALCQSRAVRT